MAYYMMNPSNVSAAAASAASVTTTSSACVAYRPQSTNLVAHCAPHQVATCKKIKKEEVKCHTRKRVILASAVVAAGGAYIYEKHKCNKERREACDPY